MEERGREERGGEERGEEGREEIGWEPAPIGIFESRRLWAILATPWLLVNRTMLCKARHGFIQPFFSGEYETITGTIEWPKATSRGAKRRVGQGSGRGVPLPSDGDSPPGKF